MEHFDFVYEKGTESMKQRNFKECMQLKKINYSHAAI